MLYSIPRVSVPRNLYWRKGFNPDYDFFNSYGAACHVNSTLKFQTHNPVNLLILQILVQTINYTKLRHLLKLRNHIYCLLNVCVTVHNNGSDIFPSTRGSQRLKSGIYVTRIRAISNKPINSITDR